METILGRTIDYRDTNGLGVKTGVIVDKILQRETNDNVTGNVVTTAYVVCGGGDKGVTEIIAPNRVMRLQPAVVNKAMSPSAEAYAKLLEGVTIGTNSKVSQPDFNADDFKDSQEMFAYGKLVREGMEPAKAFATVRAERNKPVDVLKEKTSCTLKEHLERFPLQPTYVKVLPETTPIPKTGPPFDIAIGKDGLRYQFDKDVTDEQKFKYFRAIGESELAGMFLPKDGAKPADFSVKATDNSTHVIGVDFGDGDHTVMSVVSKDGTVYGKPLLEEIMSNPSLFQNSQASKEEMEKFLGIGKQTIGLDRSEESNTKGAILRVCSIYDNNKELHNCDQHRFNGFVNDNGRGCSNCSNRMNQNKELLWDGSFIDKPNKPIEELKKKSEIYGIIDRQTDRDIIQKAKHILHHSTLNIGRWDSDNIGYKIYKTGNSKHWETIEKFDLLGYFPREEFDTKNFVIYSLPLFNLDVVYDFDFSKDKEWMKKIEAAKVTESHGDAPMSGVEIDTKLPIEDTRPYEQQIGDALIGNKKEVLALDIVNISIEIESKLYFSIDTDEEEGNCEILGCSIDLQQAIRNHEERKLYHPNIIDVCEIDFTYQKVQCHGFKHYPEFESYRIKIGDETFINQDPWQWFSETNPFIGGCCEFSMRPFPPNKHIDHMYEFLSYLWKLGKLPLNVVKQS